MFGLQSVNVELRKQVEKDPDCNTSDKKPIRKTRGRKAKPKAKPKSKAKAKPVPKPTSAYPDATMLTQYTPNTGKTSEISDLQA